MLRSIAKTFRVQFILAYNVFIGTVLVAIVSAHGYIASLAPRMPGQAMAVSVATRFTIPWAVVEANRDDVRLIVELRKPQMSRAMQKLSRHVLWRIEKSSATEIAKC